VAVLIRQVVVDPVWPPDAPDTNRGTVDVRVVGDRIDEIAPRIAGRADDEVVDGQGGPILPGLHDHHVHLWAWAAAATSVDVGPPTVSSFEGLAVRLRTAPGAAPTWVRAIGYHESVAGHLDRAALDRLVPDRPTRLQHASGALWILNSLALEALGLDHALSAASTPSGVELDAAGRATGRVWRADAWLRSRLATSDGSPPPDLGAISRRAASLGVTGLTDATPDHDDASLAALVAARAHGSILQRLHLMIGPVASPGCPNGRRLRGENPRPDGSESASPEWPAAVTTGPVKILLDDDRLPTFDDLVAQFERAHRHGRPVAVHCVTRTQATLLTAAIAEAGTTPGDRIEHGAVLGSDLLDTVRRLGLTVVTQPGFVFERGDRYLADVADEDVCDLWRLRSLLGAGIPVALSTDAPFGPDDPWAVARVAASRRTRAGRPLGTSERIAHRQAVALFCGEPERPARRRAVARGAPADLVVLSDPLDDSLSIGSPTVLATVSAGTVIHRAHGC
jgi:predicted amidohydrolase YtcJ